MGTTSNRAKSIGDDESLKLSNTSLNACRVGEYTTEGGREAYCYEFKCKSEDGKNVLVYFNAITGKEEQILILIEDENGTLTM